MYHGDWVSHMVQKHWRSWNCPFCPSINCSSPAILRNHVSLHHPDEVRSSQLNALISLCGTSDFNRCRGICPLCSVLDIMTSDQYQSHIDQHLDQLTASVFSDILHEAASGESKASIKHPSASHEQSDDVGPPFAKLPLTDTALKSSEGEQSSVSSISDQLKMISISKPMLEPSQKTDASKGNVTAERAHLPKEDKAAFDATISPPGSPSPPHSSHGDDSISPTPFTASTGVTSPSSQRRTHLYNIPRRGGGCYMEAHKVRGSGSKSSVVYIWTCCYCGHGGMNAQTTPACVSCGVARC